MDPLLPAARAMHDAYVAAVGWGMTHESLKPWDELDDKYRRATLSMARQTIERMDAAGLILAPAGSVETESPITVEDYETLVDPLARMAHMRWANDRIAGGWQCALGPTSARNRTSPFLMPFDMLPREEQDRQRNAVREVRGILRRAGLEFYHSPAWHELRDEEGEGAGGGSRATRGAIQLVARGLHDSYVRRRFAEGSRGDGNPALRPWEALDEDFRAANREAARQLWKIVEVFGYRLVPDDYPLDPITPEDWKKHDEALAEMLHLRWANERIARGWTWAFGQKSLDQQTSAALVPWAALPESEKAKNRQTVQDLPHILEVAHLKVAYRAVEQPDEAPETEAPSGHPITVWLRRLFS